jgi:hypothetical protein
MFLETSCFGRSVPVTMTASDMPAAHYRMVHGAPAVLSVPCPEVFVP